jgi:hypothetical protein
MPISRMTAMMTGGKKPYKKPKPKVKGAKK